MDIDKPQKLGVRVRYLHVCFRMALWTSSDFPRKVKQVNMVLALQVSPVLY